MSSQPAVVFGGPSPEHDISILTGLQATHVLAELGPTEAIYWTKTGDWYSVDPALEAAAFARGVPAKARPLTLEAVSGRGFVAKRPLDISAIVICCHGGPGEDGTLQAVFDLVGYRYTGPGAGASLLGMDKFLFGSLMATAGFPSLSRVLVEEKAPDFPPPFIVKPRFGGSSLGIEVVDDWDTALSLVATAPLMADGAVAEPFLVGCRDLNVGVRTYPQLSLSAIEAPARTGGDLYTYEQKYLAGGGLEGSPRELPAILPESIASEIRSLAMQVAVLSGLRSVARIDFLEQNGRVMVNEVNTIPGSLAAYLFVDPPVGRRELIQGMLTEALASKPRRFSSVGADGTALRTAASIAAKLG